MRTYGAAALGLFLSSAAWAAPVPASGPLGQGEFSHLVLRELADRAKASETGQEVSAALRENLEWRAPFSVKTAVIGGGAVCLDGLRARSVTGAWTVAVVTASGLELGRMASSGSGRLGRLEVATRDRAWTADLAIAMRGASTAGLNYRLRY